MRQIINIVFFVFVSTAIVNAADTRETLTEEGGSGRKWEYLVVSNASTTNFKPTTNTAMRKETAGAFGHEAFVLEQQLDKLGASGWELVSVTGSAGNPVFYFKRRK
jgi:hypothetical protein